MGVDDNIHPVRSTVPFPPHLREFRNERVQGPLYVCEVGTVKRSGFFKRGKEMLLVVTDSHVWLLRKGNEVERSAMLEDIEMAAVGWNILELHFYMETFYPVLPVRLASTQGVLETIRFLRSKVRGGEGLSMGWPPSKLQPVDKHLASYTTTRNSPVVPPNYPPEPCEAYGKIPFDASLNYSRTVALRRKSFLNGSEAARRRLVVTDRFLIIEKDGNVERKARLSDISRVTRVNYNTAAVIHFYPSLREPPLLLTEITINELISVLRYRRMKERNGEDLQVVELDSRSVWSNPWCPYDKYPPGYSCPKDKRQKNLLDNGSVVPPYYPPCVNLPEYVREDMHGYFTNFYSWVMIEDFTESEPHRTFLAVAPKCVLILLNAGRQTGTLSFRSGELGDIASIAKDRFGMHSISFKDESFPWLFKVAEERAGDWMDMINRLKPGGGDDLVLLETSDVQPAPVSSRSPSPEHREFMVPPTSRLGIRFSEDLEVLDVAPFSEGEKLGVPVGARIFDLDGLEVCSLQDFSNRLTKARQMNVHCLLRMHLPTFVHKSPSSVPTILYHEEGVSVSPSVPTISCHEESVSVTPFVSTASCFGKPIEYHLGPGEMGIFLHSNLRISGLEPGSEAAKAGVPIDGTLLAVDGRAMSDYDEARTLLAKKKGGCTLTVGVMSSLYLSPCSSYEEYRAAPGELGLFIDANLGCILEPGKQLHKAGMRPYGVLLCVNGEEVYNSKDAVAKILAANPKKRGCRVRVQGMFSGFEPFQVGFTPNVREVCVEAGRLGMCLSGDLTVLLVAPGSTAEKAGVRASSKLVAVNGAELHSFEHAIDMLAAARTQPVTLGLMDMLFLVPTQHDMQAPMHCGPVESINPPPMHESKVISPPALQQFLPEDSRPTELIPPPPTPPPPPIDSHGSEDCLNVYTFGKGSHGIEVDNDLMVTRVLSGSEGEKAGVREGLKVHAVGGEMVQSVQRVYEKLSELSTANKPYVVVCAPNLYFTGFGHFHNFLNVPRSAGCELRPIEHHLGPGEVGIFLDPQLQISGLEPGSEAAKAGVPIDGKLLAVNGRAVSDYDEARTLLAKKMGGCTLTVGIERRDDVLVQPGRLGIFLDSRNTIVRVARGSQADKAGVRVCTILEAVGGKPVRGRDHKHIQDMLVAAQKSNKPFTLSLCTNTSEPVTLKPGRHGIVCGSGNGEVIAVLPGSEGEKAGVGKGILYVVGNTLVQSKQETEEKLEELSTGKKPYSLVLLTLPRSSASESPPEPEHVPAFEHVSAPGGRAEVSGVLEVPFNAPSPDKSVTAEPLGQPTGPGLGRARAPRRGRTLRQVSC
eukprot:TRINITY_DN759_c0_g1_i6.p1 TRINITY_DN759_c0_g1~~TRINITY_DN759_c0_g1_i6.p1  ORF type:complete len:1316 (+),score=224.74 TRINITY_DN759_c0_g1_i6:54-4001(+)